MGKSKQLMLLEPRHQQQQARKPNNKNKKKKRYTVDNEYTRSDLFFWAREVRMSYNYHCVYCNKSRHLSAHHIFPKSKYKGLKYNLNNGILMCSKCHVELHQLNDVINIISS